jgi:hypothetical protein
MGASPVEAVPASILNADALPLVLLAAVTHPDVATRKRLADRLDTAIEQRRPLYTTERLRRFLRAQHGTRQEPFRLDRLAQKIAVRLLRIVFARGTPRFVKHWVRISSPDSVDDDSGLVVNHDLKSLYFERRPRGPRLKPFVGCHLLSGMIAPHLRLRQRALVRAICRATDCGFSLRVFDDLSWSPSAPVGGSLLGSGRPLASLGLTLEPMEDGLLVRTITPEGIIQFSACLARGVWLVLSGEPLGSRSPPIRERVLVGLRDFEGDEAEMPVLVICSDSEPWLRGAPKLPLELPLEDREAIARWLYPPESWLTADLLGQLL